MRLAEITDFTGFVSIPNLNRPEEASFLNEEIERLQLNFYRCIVGLDIANEIIADPTSHAELYAASKKDLVKFIYFYAIRSLVYKLTGVGYAKGKSENQDAIEPIVKPVEVYNDMVDSIALYDLTEEITNFEKVNSFGI